jgi:hypothetical protein
MSFHQPLSLPLLMISTIVTLGLFPSLSLAAKLDFIVENKTNVDLVKLSIDRINTTVEPSSLISSEVVKSGESAIVRLKTNYDTCLHDITGVFSDGDIVKERNVNLCKTEIYTFSDN